MKPDPDDTIPAEVEGEIVPARRSGTAWAWLFPILALAATAWLFWSNWKSKGPEITIHFTTAPGIAPGKTALIYRGVSAGTVSDLHLDRNLGTVVVTVRLKAFASELATAGTDYWIEQPVISLHEIAGLEAIIQGNSIHVRTHGGDTPATTFTALAAAPLEPLAAADLMVRLNSGNISFLGRGTPVFHRGVVVGEVREKGFDDEGKSEVEVIIFEKFANKVRFNSRFWAVSATAVSASPGTLRLDIPSLQGLLDGSIAFDRFSPDAGEATADTEFELSADETAARAEGPQLRISFDDGSGLRAGETRITCLGQPVGLVESITPDPAGHRVEVVARLDAAFVPLASSDSVFTLIRPSISREGVRGLDTLVTGPTIRFDPGKAEDAGTSFAGTIIRQIDWETKDERKGGTQVVLRAEAIPQFEPGAPIYHKGMIAGRVTGQRLGSDGRPELVVTIDAEFKDALRINSRFWRVPVATLAVGPGLIDVEVRGLSALLEGGIAFDAIGAPATSAAELAEFELFINEHSASAISDPVRISFDNGQGLVAGKTELRYLGIPVGIVERVETELGRVDAFARFQPGYDFLRTRGSEFAIIRPEIDLKGVHGLETLVHGVYIACAPGGGGGYAESFAAVPPEEPALQNETGFEIVIESPATKIDAGATVSYNDTPVGEVTKKTLSRDGKRILLTARIRDEHRNLVRTNSVFWDATTVEAKIGFLKVEIKTPSVVDPSGRVSFHTPDHGGALAKERTVFPLLPTEPRLDAETAPQAPRTKSPGRLRNWKH